MNVTETEQNVTPAVKNHDGRTFLIALLTSLIMITIYHLGTELCKMFCPPCRYQAPRQCYMLVPVTDFPCDSYRHSGNWCAKKQIPGCSSKEMPAASKQPDSK